MTNTKSTYLALLAVLLTPMAANAVPIIYATSGSGTALATIDAATGVGTTIGATGTTGTWAAAFGADANTIYTTVNWGVSLATLDVNTGAATIIGATGASGSMIALEFLGGVLYGAGFDGNFYSIDQVTGAATVIGNMGFFNVMDLAFDSSGTLWATQGSQLYTVDIGTGAGTYVSTLTGLLSGADMGLMFDANDVLYGTTWISNSDLYSIDTTSGVATWIAQTGLVASHGGDIYTSTSVPEPGTLALLGIGLAGMGLARRRRKV